MKKEKLKDVHTDSEFMLEPVPVNKRRSTLSQVKIGRAHV